MSNSWCTDKIFDLADTLRYCFAAWTNRRGLSHRCERSQNGVDGWQIDKKPTLMFVPELQQDTWSPTSLIPVTPRSVVGLDLSGSATSLQSQSLDVSYLAQTAQSTPVILYLPECVDRATTADS